MLEKINYIKKIYGNSTDLNTRIINIKNKEVGIIFFESSSSTKNISDFIIQSIDYILNNNLFKNPYYLINNQIFNSQIKEIKDKDIPFYLSSGFTIILVDNHTLALETRAELDRGVQEATTEPNLEGPKDSFTESHSKNLGLIRKRIKDPNLWFEDLFIGRRTKTRVTISYINGITNKNLIKKVKKRLKEIDNDYILDSSNLKSFLIKEKTNFPLIRSSERPDQASMALLDGKIVILTENSPFCLIMPSVFTDFLGSPEDDYVNFISINFSRILKILALLLTIYTPSLYIALTCFDQSILPDELLLSLLKQRQSVPFPTPIEIIMLMIIFDILKESDVRSPVKMGTSMSIVGALVLGDAAVNAGIVSPIGVVIIAITSICSLVFSDQEFINSIRLWRFIFILASSLLGIIGISSLSVILLIHLCSLKEFNTYYMSPISPLDLYANKNAILKFPINKIFYRPSYLKTEDKVREK